MERSAKIVLSPGTAELMRVDRVQFWLRELSGKRFGEQADYFR
jgi:hypothetical protein